MKSALEKSKLLQTTLQTVMLSRATSNDDARWASKCLIGAETEGAGEAGFYAY